MIKKVIWAPWRMKYITAPGDEECIFCKAAKGTNDRKNYVLYRGKKIFGILNLFPYNNGHVMIAPYEHTGELEKLSKTVLHEMNDTMLVFVRKIQEKMNPDGFNVGINIGKPAGAGFDKHLHMHIVPRWGGGIQILCRLPDP